jgi:hypothetical protein
MLDATGILIILWGPTVLLLLSAVASVQFNAVLLALGSFVRSRGTSGLWLSLQPGLLQVVKTLEEGFKGKTVSSNQLLLTAVILAVLYSAERGRLARRQA